MKQKQRGQLERAPPLTTCYHHHRRSTPLAHLIFLRMVQIGSLKQREGGRAQLDGVALACSLQWRPGQATHAVPHAGGATKAMFRTRT